MKNPMGDDPGSEGPRSCESTEDFRTEGPEGTGVTSKGRDTGTWGREGRRGRSPSEESWGFGLPPVSGEIETWDVVLEEPQPLAFTVRRKNLTRLLFRSVLVFVFSYKVI